MRKPRSKIVIVILLILFVLPVVFLLCERLRGQVSLARYKRVLIAKGEKLTVHDLTLPSLRGENGAPEILEATKDLKEGIILPKHCPPRMKLTPPGRAIICFQEEEWVDEWVEGKVTNRWDQLAADLEANAATLGRIRAALEKPVMDNKLDFSLGFRMLIPHLAPAKSLTWWFGARCQLALHEGRTRDALGDLLAQIQLPRLLAEDRVAISELLRIAIAAVARTDTWEALQAEGWTDEDLARVQQAWASHSFAAALARSLEGELVYGDSSFEMLRKSNEETIAALYGLEEYLPAADSERSLWERTLQNLPGGEAVAEFLKKQVYCRVWRFAWLDQDERRYLEFMQRLLAIARSGTTNDSFVALEPAINRLHEDLACKNLYDKLRYPTPDSPLVLSGVINKAMRAETERSLVICAIVLKRYSLRHGTLPASLDALVPEFVSSVPIDYMDGKPLKYHLNAGGAFVLYSVGADGKDDGGDATLLPDKTNLRKLWDRKDCVWPSPALPDEIAAYRKES
jgi:hypothetical protein